MPKSKKKDKSPKSIPRSQQDVDRAFSKGKMTGMEFILNCITWVLVDRHNAPEDDLNQLAEELRYLLESISRGYCSYPDIVKTLKKEYDFEVSVITSPLDKKGVNA